MGLFFQENASKKASKGKKHHLPVETLRAKSCLVCPLNNAALNNPKMPASGERKPDGYVLGEAPGEEEDKLGKQFVGKAGKRLRSALPDLFWRFNNTIQCRPPNNRNPTDVEIECCRNRVIEDIERTKPAFIVATGNVPTSWILGESAAIYQWRGKRFAAKIGTHTCWVYPVYHPSYVDRKQGSWGKSDEERIFERDLARVERDLDRGLPKPRIQDFDPDQVVCIYGKRDSDLLKIDRMLKRMSLRSRSVGIDVETYPLRPYNKHSVLVSIAIADGDQCLAFPIERDGAWTKAQRAKLLGVLKDFMLNPLTKVCHNQDMEMTWLASRLGIEMFTDVNWADTMALAYVLDNRLRTLSLDFQCREHLGNTPKGRFKLNLASMHTEPLEEVLPYNGLDAIACRALYVKLFAKMKSVGGLRSVYQSHIDRARVYSHSSFIGVPVNKTRLYKYETLLQDEIENSKRAISKTADARKFKRMFGRSFVPDNERDERDLFVSMLKRKEVYVERRDKKKGGTIQKVSFDKNVMAKIDRPICHAILRYREASKLLSTYITPIPPMLEFDGKIHAQVNDKFTATSRTSFENPNLQNFPRRKSAWIRGYVKPRSDRWFLGYDYGQIEARVIAMLSGDKRFVHALWNHLDIHMDWTEVFLDRLSYMWDRWSKLTNSDDEKVVKKGLRDAIKNKWVFPSFFGASTQSRARYMDISEREAMDLDSDFWDDFEGVKRWQEKQKKAYDRDGFLVLPTGRRVYGPLTLNDVFNYPVQGTASEIQKDAMVRIYKRYSMVYTFEIHDDLTYDVARHERGRWRKRLAKLMCLCPFEWVNVPITVECKEGPDWARMEETVSFESTEFDRKLRAAARRSQDALRAS